MRQLIPFLFITCFVASSVYSQDFNSENLKNAKFENKPVTKNDCCCNDTFACFEKDINYTRNPLDGSKDIIFDFKAKALGIPKNLKIKKGDFIRVKVVNYNPFVYRVSIDNKDSAVTQPNDSGFLGMFLTPDKFTSAIANLITASSAPPPISLTDKGKTTGDYKSSEKVSFLKRYNINSEGFSSKEIDRQVKELLEAEKRVEEKVKLIIEHYIEDTKVKKTIILNIRDSIEYKLSEISKDYAQLQRLYLDCKNLDPEKFINKASFYDTTLKKILKKSQNTLNSLFDSSSQFKLALADYMNFINGHPWFKMSYSFVDTFYKIATGELINIDTSISSKKINELYASFIKIAQNTACYTSLPIYIGNDIKVFSIGLKPVDVNSNLPSYQTSFSIPNFQSRIWGVSGGIFVTGLHNDLYTNRRKENDTTYNLILDKQGEIQLGVNALAYMGWQLTSKQPNYFGVSFGAGMSLESKPKPRVLLGISYITGEKNRISFSTGITGGFVSQLSDAFSSTTNYIMPAENYQKDIMKMSGFLSINYSFLSK